MFHGYKVCWYGKFNELISDGRFVFRYSIFNFLGGLTYVTQTAGAFNEIHNMVSIAHKVTLDFKFPASVWMAEGGAYLYIIALSTAQTGESAWILTS